MQSKIKTFSVVIGLFFTTTLYAQVFTQQNATKIYGIDPITALPTNFLDVNLDGSINVNSVANIVSAAADITKFGGSNVITGIGNSGAGIPRVTISSDSSITNITGTVSLPTGAATAANQTTINSSIGSMSAKFGSLGQKTMAGSAPVVIASDQSAVPVSGSVSVSNFPSNQSVTEAGHTKVALARNDYTSVNVTTAAYVQLVSSTSDTVNSLYVFDSSGQTILLAVGAAGFEVDQIYIPPGGNGLIDLLIAAGSRVSIKAVSGTASSGEINISFLK